MCEYSGTVLVGLLDLKECKIFGRHDDFRLFARHEGESITYLVTEECGEKVVAFDSFVLEDYGHKYGDATVKFGNYKLNICGDESCIKKNKINIFGTMYLYD